MRTLPANGVSAHTPTKTKSFGKTAARLPKIKAQKALLGKGILKKNKRINSKFLRRSLKKISFKPSFNENRLPNYCHSFSLTDNFWCDEEVAESTYCASESTPVMANAVLTLPHLQKRYSLRNQLAEQNQVLERGTDVWPDSKQMICVVPEPKRSKHCYAPRSKV